MADHVFQINNVLQYFSYYLEDHASMTCLNLDSCLQEKKMRNYKLNQPIGVIFFAARLN